MAQEIAVITYGNGDILREIFNAIAASMGDSTFKTLIHLSILLAGTWAIGKLIFKRDLMVGVGWIGLYFMAFYVLFLPKATVNIIDRVQHNEVAVDNVPLGLAWLANVTTAIGDGLTQLMEQNFSLPDDLRYGQTGMVMASNLVTAASTFQVTDPDFEKNLQGFIHQCVFYDLLLHKYSSQELFTAPNIWQFVTEKASPARAFLYNQTVVTCRDGVASLNQDWQTAITQAEDRYAARLFPEETNAKTQLLKYLPLSYSFLTDLSESASDLMQQNMMSNAVQSGLLNWSAQTNAPAALEGYAFNKAQQQNRISNRTIGDMAAYWLPLLKNIFEGILYGSFVFIFLLILFPFGLAVLRQYAYSLLWLQLWAPLYAIINLYVNFYAQHRSLGAITFSDGMHGLVLATQSGLAQVNSDMAGLAGYISLSVPLIATSLVTGLHHALSHLGQYVGGAVQSSATASAGEAAAGSFSLGNTSFSTHNAYNTSANHFDDTARTASGTVTDQMPGGSTITMTADGSVVMNNQPAISSLGAQIHLGEAIRSSATEQADKAYSAALSHQRASSEAMSVAERGVYELSHHQALSEASGSSFVTSHSVSDLHALNDLQQQVVQAGEGRNESESASKNRTMSAGLKGQLGLGVKGTLGVVEGSGSIGGDAGVQWSWDHRKSDQESFSHSESAAHNTGYAENMDTALRAVSEGHYRANTEEGKRILDSISTSLDRAHQEQQQASAQFQQAETYRKIASISEEQSATINANATQEFMNEMQKNGQDLRSIEKMMVDHPEQGKAQAEQFMHKKVEEYFHQFHEQENSSPEKVNEISRENTQILEKESFKNPTQLDNTQKLEIKAQADQEGLGREHTVDNQFALDVQKIIAEKTAEVEDGQKQLESKQNETIREVSVNQERLQRLDSKKANHHDSNADK
ncbi:MAG: conjugal transfer protein TraG N-terminal domain-containing protein [Proteobacteria bacterium]|nr:conjugal transfer protein TraG N-terminal domain-containing protein [Pseudomonadota bacterium]